TLNRIRMFDVVTGDPCGDNPARVLITGAPAPAQATPERASQVRRRQQLERVLFDVSHHGPTNFDGIILLGFRTCSDKVVCPEIDATHKSQLTVNHDDLSVQPAEQVGTEAEPTRLWIENVQSHPGL